jgi:hypothetical protein
VGGARGRDDRTAGLQAGDASRDGVDHLTGGARIVTGAQGRAQVVEHAHGLPVADGRLEAVPPVKPIAVVGHGEHEQRAAVALGAASAPGIEDALGVIVDGLGGGGIDDEHRHLHAGPVAQLHQRALDRLLGGARDGAAATRETHWCPAQARRRWLQTRSWRWWSGGSRPRRAAPR